MQMQQMMDGQTIAVQRLKNMTNSNWGSLAKDEIDEEELSRSAFISFREKEEEIEKKKVEVKEKVQTRLSRVEEESKRLAEIREELEALNEPKRKELAAVRKKIDAINRELKPLGHTCHKKEREYKDALHFLLYRGRRPVADAPPPRSPSTLLRTLPSCRSCSHAANAPPPLSPSPPSHGGHHPSLLHLDPAARDSLLYHAPSLPRRGRPPSPLPLDLADLSRRQLPLPDLPPPDLPSH